MKCGECGTENPENAQFCLECGNKINPSPRFGGLISTGKVNFKDVHLSGIVFFTVLVSVIAICGIVFGTTMLGSSGTSTVTNYDDKIVAATVTSFAADLSSGYQTASQETSLGSTGTEGTQSSSGAASSRSPTTRSYRGYNYETGQSYKGTETNYGSVIHVHNDYSVPSRPMGQGSFYGT